MQHDEIYDKFCKSQFDELKRTQQKNHEEIINLLKGEGRESGLIDDVNMLKKAYKCTIGAFVFLISTIIVQIFIYIRSKF